MADFRLNIDVEDKEVLQYLSQIGQRISSQGLYAFLELNADPFLQLRLRSRFANEGDDAVGQWAPLAPATQAIRAGMGYGAAHPINVRTQDLLNYLTSSRADVEVTGSGATLTYPPRGASPSLDNKIRTAQQGKIQPATPPRPVVALSQIDDTAITRDLAQYITQGLAWSVMP